MSARPFIFALVITEVVCGVAAYHSETWNFRNTEVLTGWPAVRYVCLIIIPICSAGAAALIGVVVLLSLALPAEAATPRPGTPTKATPQTPPKPAGSAGHASPPSNAWPGP